MGDGSTTPYGLLVTPPESHPILASTSEGLTSWPWPAGLGFPATLGTVEEWSSGRGQQVQQISLDPTQIDAIPTFVLLHPMDLLELNARGSRGLCEAA